MTSSPPDRMQLLANTIGSVGVGVAVALVLALLGLVIWGALHMVKVTVRNDTNLTIRVSVLPHARLNRC